MSNQKDTAYVSDLHFEHNLWRNELKFIKEEINILESRLMEIAAKDASHASGAGTESFHNRFELNRKHLNELNNHIKKHDAILDKMGKDPIAGNHSHVKEHKGLRKQMDTFRKLYQGMKKEFFQFAVMWH